MLASRFLRGFAADRSFIAAGNLVKSGGVITIDAGSGYKAFPGLCVMPDGNLLLVYRHGTSHVGDNGYIAGRTSTDGGTTWGSPFTIYDPADDARDPSVTRLSDDRIALSCFRYAGGLAYQTEVLFSSDNAATWGSPVVVNKTYAAHTYDEAAVSGHIVEVSPSLLLLPFYAHDVGSRWNAFVAKSTDSGASFGSNVLIASGDATGHPNIGEWTEPVITRRPSDGALICMIRLDDLAETWQSASSDNGATWSTPAASFGGTGTKGRAASVYTNNGALFVNVRGWVVQNQSQYATSWDFGATWEALTDMPSPSSVDNYGACVQLASGVVVVVWAHETSTSDCDLYAQKFLDTGA